MPMGCRCSAGFNAVFFQSCLTLYDPDCGSLAHLQSSMAMSFRRTGATSEVPSSYMCGTIQVTRECTSKDKCNRESMDDQTIYLLPETPVFTSIPNHEPDQWQTYSTSTGSFDPNAQGGNWPMATSGCGYAVAIDSTDAWPEEVAGECGLWNVKRIWTAELAFSDALDDHCEANNLPDPPAAEAIQQFYVQDDEPPRFIESVPTNLSIPFFDNYDSTRLNAPLIEDIATNFQAHEWGLFAGGETLRSHDFDFAFSPTGPDDEAQCRANGIASFHRGWTAADECGNEQSFEQKITIEHPPEVLTSPLPPSEYIFSPSGEVRVTIQHLPESLTATESLSDGVCSYSPGVTQASGACAPGKLLLLSFKEFSADFNFTDPNPANVCAEGQPWDENGCRLESSTNVVEVEVLSVKPEFVTFPEDVTVNTKESISPVDTGIPTGEAFCSTPFEIVHEDDEAVLVECGVWEIHRRWTIRPVYFGCEKVTDSRLITERVQVLTVEDIFPPEFIFLPVNQEVDVPFLGNYGPANPAVDYPRVQEQVYHPTLIAHANLYNTAEKFMFVSHETTLFYNDAIDFKESAAEVCEAGSLADVSRTWTTKDRCGNTREWVQTIHIVKPTDLLCGEASGYQIASPNGHVEMHHTQVSHVVMSKGADFKMTGDSSIYCGNGDCNDSDISLVLDMCPVHKLKESFLPDGTVLYLEDPPPTNAPTKSPSAAPSLAPSTTPSATPTDFPSSTPSTNPSSPPSSTPSMTPSSSPSLTPSTSPSGSPSAMPSMTPSSSPSSLPSTSPSSSPSSLPSTGPSDLPSSLPSTCPSNIPSSAPSETPSSEPSYLPSGALSPSPTSVPSLSPSGVPNGSPSENPSLSPVGMTRNLGHGICEVYTAVGSNTKDRVSFLLETDFPVNYYDAAADIQSWANFVDGDPVQGPELLTGPQTINCTTPDQSSCYNVVMSSIVTETVQADPVTGDLYLTGLHRVYNSYEVTMGDWFFDTNVFQTPPRIVVEADGFVFVNVVDEVQITALPEKSNKAVVSRSWGPSADSFECRPTKNNLNPIINNLPRLGRFYNETDRDLMYDMKTITTSGTMVQDPGTHMMVNLWTSATIDLSAPVHKIDQDEAMLCSGLRFEFRPEDEISETKGTYLLTNPMSSYELWNYTWTGGQLMNLGRETRLRSVTMQGLYLPDASSFCDAGSMQQHIMANQGNTGGGGNGNSGGNCPGNKKNC